MRAAGFQEPELGDGIDLQVPFRELHAVGVADLAGQIEDHAGAAELLADSIRVADIPLDDGYAVAHWLDVVRIRTAAWNQAVNDGDPRTEPGEPNREVAADEAQSPGNQDTTTSVIHLVLPLTLEAVVCLYTIHGGWCKRKSALGGRSTSPVCMPPG